MHVSSQDGHVDQELCSNGSALSLACSTPENPHRQQTKNTKMEATTRPQTQELHGTQVSSPAPDPLLFSPLSGALVSIQQAGDASPASTESLTDHAMDDYLLTPMEEGSSHSQGRESHLIHHPNLPTNIVDMFSRFADMLSIGLSQTAAKITGDIKAELQNLGSRMETIEPHLDITISRTNQTERI